MRKLNLAQIDLLKHIQKQDALNTRQPSSYQGHHRNAGRTSEVLKRLGLIKIMWKFPGSKAPLTEQPIRSGSLGLPILTEAGLAALKAHG